jgi:uncharacterized protein (DUF983 family)
VFFQNVYRAGVAGCIDCLDAFARKDLDGDGVFEVNPPSSRTQACPLCGCIPCDELVLFNEFSQVEPGFDVPVFSAHAYDVLDDGSLGELVEFVDPEPDSDTPAWVTMSNTNRLAWGRWDAEFAIVVAGKYRIDLALDDEVFATFNMTVRPAVAAAEVTQVISAGVSLPGSADMFSAESESGQAARDNFMSGISNMFGVSGDSVRIVGVRDRGTGGDGLALDGRRLQGTDDGSVEILYELQVASPALNETAAETNRIAAMMGSSDFSESLGAHIGSSDVVAVDELQLDEPAATVSSVRAHLKGDGLKRAAVDGQIRSFVVRLYDEFDNVDSIDSSELAIADTTGGMEVQSIRFDPAQNAYVVEYLAASCPGSLEFSLLVNGKPIGDTVYSIPCVASDAHGEHSVATYPYSRSVGAPQELTAGETEEIYITLYDATGTPRTSGGDASLVAVEITAPDGTTCGQQCSPRVVDMTHGEYKVSYSVQQAGEYSVAVSVKHADGTSHAIQHSPFVSVVKPGQIDAAQCNVEWSALELPVATWVTATITARDKYGNDVEWLDADAAFVILPAHLEHDTSESTPFALRVRSMSGGEMPMSVHYRRPDGLTRPVGKPASVRFLAGDASLEHSTLAAGHSFVRKCVAGEDSNIVVQVADSAGNPTSMSVDDISVTVQQCDSMNCDSISGSTIAGTAETVGTELHLSYRTPTTGYYQLRVTRSGADVHFASFASPMVVLSDLDVTAAACVATGDGIAHAAVGEHATFAVQTNSMSATHEHFVVAATGAVLTDVSQKYVGDGAYVLTYTAVSSQDSNTDWSFDLSVSLHGEEISGSPFTARMLAGPPVQAVLDESQSTLVATAGETSSLYVHTVDMQGNTATVCTETVLSTTLSSGKMVTLPQLVQCQDGVYEFQYSISTVGHYDLFLDYNGAPVDSLHSVTIQSAAISATESFAAADTSTLSRVFTSAVAGIPTEVFIHARDSFSNALTQAACSDGTTDCMMVELRWCHTAGSHHKTLDTAAVAACLQMPVSKASVAVKPVDSSTYEVSTTLDRSGVYLAAISVRTEGGTHALSNSGFTLSVSAPEASYTVSSTCSGDECYCKPGYEISDTEASDGKIVCSLCPQGTFKAGFSNDATCTACPASTSTVVDIAASVDACQCPSGLYNTHHTTVQCIDQDWTSPVALESGSGELCAPCPACAVCHADGTVAVREGYWSFPTEDDGVITAYKCSSESGHMCSGGLVSTDSVQCAEGSEGITCSVCKAGFTRTDQGCESCDSLYGEATSMDAQDVVLVVSLVAFALFMGFIMMKQAKAEDVLKLKILIGFGQVIQSFASTYAVQWPANLRAFINMFTLLSFDVLSLGHADCSDNMRWASSFYARFAVTVLMPIAFGLLIWVCWKLQMKKSHSRRARAGATSPLEQKIGDIEISGQWASRGFFILVLTYLQVSTTILEVFKCRQFEPSDGGESRLLLAADPTISCDDSTYMGLKVAAIFGAFLYPIGVPAFFVLLLWRERKNIHDSVNQKKYGFLFGDYVAIYFLWEVWDLGRKLALSGALMFFNKGSVSQLLVAMVIALFALELQLRMMPYKSLMANVIQVAAFNAILLNLVGAMLLKVDFRAEDYGLGESFADGFLVLINLTVPVLVLFTLAFSMGQDLYRYTVGQLVQGGFMGRSREALLEAIAQRQQSQAEGAKEQIAEAAEDLSYGGADLSAEATEVSRRRMAYKNAEASLQQAEAELDEKREWYRFVYNHTNNLVEFHEMCQSETPQSYRRLLGVAGGETPSPSGTKQQAIAETVSTPNPMADTSSAASEDMAASWDIELPKK